MYILYRTEKEGELALALLLYLATRSNRIDNIFLCSINTVRQSRRKRKSIWPLPHALTSLYRPLSMEFRSGRAQ